MHRRCPGFCQSANTHARGNLRSRSVNKRVVYTSSVMIWCPEGPSSNTVCARLASPDGTLGTLQG